MVGKIVIEKQKSLGEEEILAFCPVRRKHPDENVKEYSLFIGNKLRKMIYESEGFVLERIDLIDDNNDKTRTFLLYMGKDPKTESEDIEDVFSELKLAKKQNNLPIQIIDLSKRTGMSLSKTAKIVDLLATSKKTHLKITGRRFEIDAIKE